MSQAERWLFYADGGPDYSELGTWGDIRDMHFDGTLTQDEYEAICEASEAIENAEAGVGMDDDDDKPDGASPRQPIFYTFGPDSTEGEIEAMLQGISTDAKDELDITS